MSLVELLISAVIAGILIIFVAKVASSVMKSKIKSDESSAFIQVENAITQTIARRMSFLVNTSCNGGGKASFTASFNATDQLSLPGMGVIKATRSVQYPIDHGRDIEAAIGRCNQDPIVPYLPTNPTGSDQPGAYYFCVQFDRGGLKPISNTAFFDAEAAFAEIRINLVNTSDALAVHSGPFLSCNQFIANQSGGVVVYYKTYWRKKGDPTEFSQAGKVLLPK